MTASIPALLQPLKDRLAAATPGPWKTVRHDLSLYVESESGELNPISLGYVGNRPERDGDFIAAAPTDQAKLIAAIEAVAGLHEHAFRRVEGWAAGYRFSGDHCAFDGEDWPCATYTALIQALGGEAA